MFLVNMTPKELTPCKISHICRCAFNIAVLIGAKGDVNYCYDGTDEALF